MNPFIPEYFETKEWPSLRDLDLWLERRLVTGSLYKTVVTDESSYDWLKNTFLSDEEAKDSFYGNSMEGAFGTLLMIVTVQDLDGKIFILEDDLFHALCPVTRPERP